MSSDKAFEVFIKRAVTSIAKESWGRSREAKELRDACQHFLSTLDAYEAGTISYDGSLAAAVLHPLQLACASNNVKVVELALGALHKLVAHAWLQGESSASEDLIYDDADVVTRVIRLVIKCGEISNASLQLSVIRALLTFATAEHFVAHGDSLMSAVRTVFNLALGSEDENIKRTACNALLQMLNTVAKRVTVYHHSMSTTPSRRVSDQGSASDHGLSQEPRRSFGASPHTSLSRRSGQAFQVGSDGGRGSGADSGVALAAEDTQGEVGPPQPDARLAQLASLAEQRDIRGLEAAIGAPISDNPLQHGLPQPGPSPRPGTAGKAGGGSSGPDSSGAAGFAEDGSSSATLGLDSSSSAAQVGPGSLGALQRTISTNSQPDGPSGASGGGSGGARGGSTHQAPAPPTVLQLSVMERDVLLVLTAFCKLASREAGLTEVESYLHQGKLLALELLVKVLQNPQHRWENVRDAFMHHLRQPLCITLLRNCLATDPAAFQLAIKLLLAVMTQPKLRRGLKAELGAFYPLFVLRPLENGAGIEPAAGAGGSAGAASSVGVGGVPGGEQTDLNTLFVVLGSLKQLCSEPQLMADLFVNYDCDQQAPPLFERTMQALGRLAQKTDLSNLVDRPAPGAASLPPAKQQQEMMAKLAAIRDVALKCVTSAVHSLDMWAAPLKEAAAAQLQGAGNGGASSGSAGAGAEAEAGSEADAKERGTPTTANEAERLEAVWAHKSTFSKGLALFNSSPVKGIKFCVAQGLVEHTPQAVAAFLRTHLAEWDKNALGEYMGHHGDFEVAVMHAFVDAERYQGMVIDVALRKLLAQFRLPGEAQKIDRIMEKFAERFVRDNPGKFINADGAYLLSFAIIMLNTDAHNPLAERRLGKQDFVVMCQQQMSEEEGGGFEPVLPPAELEAIYERITAEEIQVHDPEGVQQRQAAAAAHRQAARAQSRNRLAAALGLHALAAPFKPLTRGLGGLLKGGQEGSGLSDVDRKRMVSELAERLLAATRGSGGGGSGAGLWASAVHAELSRPMLLVSADPVLGALAFGLAQAPTATAGELALRSLVVLVQLAGLLRLDELVERTLSVLAGATGVFGPAAYSSPQEAKQLQALKSLMALPGSAEGANQLGSGWAIVLRTLSALDALGSELKLPQGTLSQQGTPGGTQASSQAASAANPFSNLFQALGISLLGGSGSASPMGTPRGGTAVGGVHTANGHLVMMVPGHSSANGDSVGGGHGEPVAVPLRMAPGAALVVWAETEGRHVLEQVVAGCQGLDGDAVVVFLRALCAVSREELELDRPRIFSLERLVEAANLNLGRIRLVWGKLWAVISAHLVASTCHTLQSVALYAVDKLSLLAGKLLARSELSYFRAQEEALRPFVAVLRQCDDPVVREAVVARVVQLAVAHGRSLGSGWRTLLEVLRRAAGDSHPQVCSQAVEGLAVAVEALYMGPAPAGHEYLRETVRAAVVAAHNQLASEDVSMEAVQLVQACAARLAEYREQHGQLPAAQPQASHRSLSAALQPMQSQEHPEAAGPGAKQVSGGGGTGPSPHASQGGGVHSGGGAAEASQRCALPTINSIDFAALPEDCWALLLASLADIAQQDPRARVSHAAMQSIFDIMQQHSSTWSEAAWGIFLTRVMSSMFRPAPTSARHPGSSAAGAGPAGPHTHHMAEGATGSLPSGQAAAEADSAASGTPSPEFVARVNHYFPMMCEQLDHVAAAYHGELMLQLADTSLHWLQQPHEALATSGLSNFEQLLTQVGKRSELASWEQLVGMLSKVLQQELKTVMGQSEQLQAQRLRELGPASLQPLRHMPLPQSLRCRSRTLVMAHRLLARLHAQHAQQLPWVLQLQLVQPLLSTAHASVTFNQQLQQAAVKAMAQQPPIIELSASMPAGVAYGAFPAAAGSDMGPGAVASVRTQGHSGAPAASSQAEPQAPHTPTSPSPTRLYTAAAPAGGTGSPFASEAMARSVVEGMEGDVGAAGSGQAEADSGSGSRAQAEAQQAGAQQQQIGGMGSIEAERVADTILHTVNAGTKFMTAGGQAAGEAAGTRAAGQGPLSPAQPQQTAGRGAAAHGVLLSSADGSSLQHLGLGRMEVECMGAAMDALEHSIHVAQSAQSAQLGPQAGSIAMGETEAAAALAMLQDLCLFVISQTAGALTSLAEIRAAAPGAGGLPKAQPQDGDEQSASGYSGGPTWLEGMRAPLLARAVLTYLQLPSAAHPVDVQNVFPHMLVLMCSRDERVRSAVAVWFKSAVQPLIDSAAQAAGAPKP